MERNTILLGNALSVLKTLPDASVHCIVTSPPYYNLRAYGTEPQVWGGDPDCEHEWTTERYYREGGNSKGSGLAFSEPGPENAQRIKDTRWRDNTRCSKCEAWLGELGQEPNPQEFIAHLIEIFDEIWRVLRPDGTCWVNLGDSFSNDSKWGGKTSGKHAKGLHGTPVGRGKHKTGFKPKDLMLIPHRFAIAMQDRGWWVRSEIPWAKGNPMPESVTDRLSRTHEYIFQFNKSQRYFFDLDAIRVPPKSQGRKPGNKSRAFVNRDLQHEASHKMRPSDDKSYHPAGKNPGDVWLINIASFKGAHFATMSPEVARRCILASTSPQVCEQCGAPWKRITKRETHYEGNSARAGRSKEDINTTGKWRSDNMSGNKNLKSGPVVSIKTLGWQQTCKCENSTGSARAIVLDPFFGSGTTGEVATEHGRDYQGIELNPEYKLMAEDRLSKGIQMTLFDAA